jgi:hypothetical protein
VQKNVDEIDSRLEAEAHVHWANWSFSKNIPENLFAANADARPDTIKIIGRTPESVMNGTRVVRVQNPSSSSTTR